MTSDNLKIIKSPLRYPGGKGSLYAYFTELIKFNELKGGKYFEPYVGGGGIALSLLSSNTISEAMINDADYHIYCFWSSVLKENERFIERINNANLSIKEWQLQRLIYSEVSKKSAFDVGFATFYLNRCNRSGILVKAGPIGGYKQKGKWRLDARFNKNTLIKRIGEIKKLNDKISVKNMDAITFLKKYLPRGYQREKVFVYLDPPYVSAGRRLYLNYYSNRDHEILAGYLLNQTNLKWLVTYDDHIFIKKLYSSCQKWIYYLEYSLQAKKQGRELLIAPECLQLPNQKIFSGKRRGIMKKLRRLKI